MAHSLSLEEERALAQRFIGAAKTLLRSHETILELYKVCPEDALLMPVLRLLSEQQLLLIEPIKQHYRLSATLKALLPDLEKFRQLESPLERATFFRTFVQNQAVEGLSNIELK
jgi:hypothetical protein